MISASTAPVARTHRRAVVRYVVSALLTVLFLYLAFRGTDLEGMLESMKSANYFWLLLSLAVLILSHLVRAWRWRYLLEPITPNLPMRSLFSGVMVGYFLNNILPRAGELGRAYAIGKLEDVPKSAAFGTIVAERLIDMVTFLLLVALLPLFYNGPLKEEFPWLNGAGLLSGAIVVLVTGLLVLLMQRRDWADAFVRFVSMLLPAGPARRVDGIVHSFLDGMLFLKHPRRIAAIVLLSAAVWFLYIVVMYFGVVAFGLTSAVGFRGSVVVLTISSLGVAVPTPGSTGGYHAFTSQALTRLFAVGQNMAVSFATLTHAVGFIGVTLLGLLYFWRDNITMSGEEKGGREHD